MKWFRKKLDKQVTIVTALADIGRSDLRAGFERPYIEYLDKFKEILAMPYAMVIYADSVAEQMIRQHRQADNTVVIPFDKAAIEALFPYKALTDTIRTSEEWVQQAAWLRESPQAKLEWYNPLVMSKMMLLDSAASKNHFNTSHLYWLDAGIAGTVHPGYFWHDKVFDRPEIFTDQFSFVAYPYTSNTEIHGFPRSDMHRMANNRSVAFVCRGGFFGGPVHTIAEVSENYQSLLKSTLEQGLMGTEESLFTLMAYTNNTVQCYFIEENGLLSTFFEALKNNNVNKLLKPSPVLSVEPIASEFVLSEADIEQWHHTSELHFHNTIQRIKTIVPEKSVLNYIDAGCSTGAFFESLQQYYTIEKALLIEPFEEAISLARKKIKAPGILFENKACWNSTEKLYLHLSRGDNNNLGICTVQNYAETPSRPVQGETLSSLITASGIQNVSLIKIHTPDHQFEILEGLREWMTKAEHLPLIVFDYGYYRSKDELSALLNTFYKAGYKRIDLHTEWGGDLILIPESLQLYNGVQLNAGTINTESAVNKTSKSVSTYIITYNFPQQLEMLFKSFEDAGRYLLEQTNLIVLNNSDDPSTDEAYDALLAQYGAEQIKLGNLGICGGRQFVADHFDLSEAEYMFFFEDDMLLHKAEPGYCRNGFSTWRPDLFENAVEILKREGFDFLKLSFTEFFGDNKTQWAWHNVPHDFRIRHFPEHPLKELDGIAVSPPLTSYEHVKIHAGIPYVTGEVYYCNWPHVIGKAGNAKMFLETRWAHPYEQTWMSHFYQMTIKGQLKPSLLLMSPINHNRVYHYSAAQRKENNPELSVDLQLMK